MFVKTSGFRKYFELFSVPKDIYNYGVSIWKF